LLVTIQPLPLCAQAIVDAKATAKATANTSANESLFDGASEPNFAVPPPVRLQQSTTAIVPTTTVPTSPQATPPAISAPTQATPLFDPKTELKGSALIAALKLGGFVLYMRHAISTNGSDGALATTPSWWENCAIQRNIADAGRVQARKVGAALRALNVPIEEIKTSQFCRARDTAHEMGLGAIEITEDLNHAIGQRPGFDVNVARFALLSRKPTSGSNVLLVSHTHGSPRTEERAMGSIQEAEIVVYRPNQNGGTEPIGRILVSEWDSLLPNPHTAQEHVQISSEKK
jgi:phosphohistidine phosphatase SixA